MVRWRFSRDRDRWQSDLKAWGYPAGEYVNVVMVEVGDGDGWFWFEFVSQEVAIVHLAVRPGVRGYWWRRNGGEGLRWVAELLGLKRVYYVDNGYNKKIGEYVKRLGWTEFEGGYFLEV